MDARRVGQMAAMDSDSAGGGAPADFQYQDVGLRRVFFIVFVAGVDEEFVAGETLRPVTLFASFPRRPEVLDGRRNRTRIGVEGYGGNLAQSGKFGSDK